MESPKAVAAVGLDFVEQLQLRAGVPFVGCDDAFQFLVASWHVPR